ncbi:hypothetical protein C4K09_4413 [Pseudomonas chlororaphis subsp. aureofaciens]|nr:hypothetical protein C4K09_4413 [Pseudomonas chlororaphis subsp. aureofaciens]
MAFLPFLSIPLFERRDHSGVVFSVCLSFLMWPFESSRQL